MTEESRLVYNMRRVLPKSLWITQGVVTAVDGLACSVAIGDATIEGIRLRASLSSVERDCLIVPKVGTAVILGSLSEDLNDMVVIQVDEAESIHVNGGRLGGLVNIADLTDRLNNLVDEVNRLRESYNSHTHTVASGKATPTMMKAAAMTAFDRIDYEDTTIKH